MSVPAACAPRCSTAAASGSPTLCGRSSSSIHVAMCSSNPRATSGSNSVPRCARPSRTAGFAPSRSAASASTPPARWSPLVPMGAVSRSPRTATPSATSSCGWTTALSPKPPTSTGRTTRRSPMSAARSASRWNCRRCSGCGGISRERHASVQRYFDLADYLVWRATGADVASICTLTCKWNYLAHEQRFSESCWPRWTCSTCCPECRRRCAPWVRLRAP